MRIVLDTNAWLDWLVFRDPSIDPIEAAVTAGALQIVIDEPCDAELERALGYDLGRYSLAPPRQAEALQRSRAIALRVTTEGASATPTSLPRCRDPDDQKFLTLALAAGAHVLITRDRALLELTRRRFAPLPFRIVTPRAAAELLPAAVRDAPAPTLQETP